MDLGRHHSTGCQIFATENKISYADALEQTKVLIRQAVERRLISERPLGSFLSGGFDSTVVTAYMAQLMPNKVKTFSIGFNDPRYDESAYARAVAKYLGTEHVEEKLSPDPALLFTATCRDVRPTLCRLINYSNFHVGKVRQSRSSCSAGRGWRR